MNSSAVITDALYQCLVLIQKLYTKTKGINELLSGLPVGDHDLSLKAFIRAVERGGMSAKIKKLPLKKLLKE